MNKRISTSPIALSTNIRALKPPAGLEDKDYGTGFRDGIISANNLVFRYFQELQKFPSKEVVRNEGDKMFYTHIQGKNHEVRVPCRITFESDDWVLSQDYMALAKENIQLKLDNQKARDQVLEMKLKEASLEEGDTIRIPEGYRLLKDDYNLIFWAISAAVDIKDGKTLGISYLKFIDHLNKNQVNPGQEIEYVAQTVEVMETNP